MNEGEKRVVGKMITIYCRSKHRSGEGLCEECKSKQQVSAITEPT